MVLVVTTHILKRVVLIRNGTSFFKGDADSVIEKFCYASFQASAAVWMRSSLFCDGTKRWLLVTDFLEQRTFPTFKDQTDVLTLMNYYSVQCVFRGTVTVEYWTFAKRAVCVYLGATFVHFKDLMKLHDKLQQINVSSYILGVFSEYNFDIPPVRAKE